jgi:hypothetical protein
MTSTERTEDAVERTCAGAVQHDSTARGRRALPRLLHACGVLRRDLLLHAPVRVLRGHGGAVLDGVVPRAQRLCENFFIAAAARIGGALSRLVPQP